MARTFVEAHLDFPAIETDLATIEPPKLTLEQVLERISPQIIAASQRGATNEQIRDSLKAHGITVSASAVARIVAGAEAEEKKAAAARPAKGKQQQSPPPASQNAGGEQRTLV